MFLSFRRLCPWFRAAFRFFRPRSRHDEESGALWHKSCGFSSAGRRFFASTAGTVGAQVVPVRPSAPSASAGGAVVSRRVPKRLVLLRGGAPASSHPPDRLHAKYPACTVSRCKRGAWSSGRKRAVGQKRGPLSPCPPCPPPGGGMTGRNLPPERPSGPRPSGGSGILAPPKMLRR